MNKKVCMVLLAFGLLGGEAVAQDAVVFRSDLDKVQEEIKLLQRRIYNSEESDLGVKLGHLDELTRGAAGRLDELEHNLQALEEKIDMINKDIDVRMDLLEGKAVSGGVATNVVDNSPKFSAPIASNAPKSIVGDAITGDDLEPVKLPGAADIYKIGLEALKANDYAKAEENFMIVLSKYPNDKLAGNAQYWLGETFYAQKAYDRAAVAFAKGYQGYKNGSKSADSLLKLGLSMSALGKKAEACGAYASLPIEFAKADTTIKDRAKSEAAKLGCK